MHIFVPKFKLKSSQSPKWFTSNIRHQIKCLRTLRKKYKSRPTEHNLLRIKTAEETLQASIQQAKANFEAKLVSNETLPNLLPSLPQYFMTILLPLKTSTKLII